jgi:hypothetical protein
LFGRSLRGTQAIVLLTRVRRRIGGAELGAAPVSETSRLRHLLRRRNPEHAEPFGYPPPATVPL